MGRERTGREPGERLKSFYRTALQEGQAEKQARRQVEAPFRVCLPHGTEGMEKHALQQNQGTGKPFLLSVTTSHTRLEVNLDREREKEKGFLTATARRPEETGGFGEEQRSFHRETALRQRKKTPVQVYLERGKRENAAGVAYEQPGHWTEEKLRLLQGSGQSQMLEAVCPYADDSMERERLSLVTKEWEQVRQQRLNLEQAAKDEQTQAQVQRLKAAETALMKRRETLHALIGKKERLKRTMLQQLKRSSQSERVAFLRAQLTEDARLFRPKALSLPQEQQEESKEEIQDEQL